MMIVILIILLSIPTDDIICLIQQNYQQLQMSSIDKRSRKSRFSTKQYQNSSVYNKSVRSELTSLSIDLPKNHRKYTNIEKQLMSKQNKQQPVVINLTNTKYPIMQEVCGVEGFNWRVENFSQSKIWNIKWIDTGMNNEILTRMNHQQKINHFPNMSIIARKNNLAVTLGKMKEQFPNQYDFMPRTFLFPNDYSKIRNYFFQSRKRGLVKTFIVKPQSGCQGRGIYITQNPTDFQKEDKCVIQKYISNPLLHKGLKFDLRIYVLLASVSPLRIYLYNQGLVRFATEEYQLPQSKNLNNFYIHLTNYAINKANPNYQYNYTVNDMTYGHKKSLAEFFKTLKEMGFKANSYWSQIKEIIIKTLITAQPYLLNNYKACRPHESTYGMCFEVLGFDFLIDNQDRVYLLEVNHTPSFSADTPLDHIIKKNLVKDTLLMMTPNQEEINIKEKLERIKQRQKYIKFKKDNEEIHLQRQMLIRQLNQARVKQETQFRGTYEMIYPCKNAQKMEKYQQGLLFAHKIAQQQPTIPPKGLPSSTQLRNKLKEGAKARVASRQVVKQNLAKQVPQNDKSKKNIIYNYNYLKKDRDTATKRTLVTLPAESHRVQVHPKEKIGSSKVIRASSKEKLQNHSLPREPVKSLWTSDRYAPSSNKSSYKELVRVKDASQRVSTEQNTSPTRQISNFSNRIRAYKTPLMF